MALSPGTSLGSFEISGLLGKGGMGEVYLARDSKLGRDVAIKVLPDSLANDPERLARLEREARILASLNDPNVATVYGFEHDEREDVHYLIMEYIDGETLGERMAGGALSEPDALRLFVGIAQGLNAAHEAGIVHRDLKPDNIKISSDGVVKILDFGIAKSTGESKPQNPSASTLPMSPIALTAEGTFIGTPVYMSPEQARGKPVDKRSDIWAFGCCLYEALTGGLPFKGDSVADTVGAILEHDPDWNELPDDLTDSIRNLLQRCLEKESRRRLSSAGDIAIALEDTREGLKRDSRAGKAFSPPQRKGMPLWAIGIVVLLLGLIGVGGIVLTKRSSSPEIEANTNQSNAFGIATTEDASRVDRPIRRYSINLPPTHPVARDAYTGGYGPLAISPDGLEVVYPALTEDGQIFMARSLERLDARPIPGTENGRYFTLSPSGQWALTYKDGAYWKISYEGGRGEKVLDAPLPFFGVWEDDTHAIFGSPALARGLVRVNLDTGEQETITEVDTSKGESVHVSFQVVPDKRVLFYIGTSGNEDTANIYAMSLDTMESKLVANGGYRPFYVETGHLLYAPKGRLMALPFDINRLEATGPARDVTAPYMSSPSTSPQGFAIMPDGDLIYVRTDGFGGGNRSLVWVGMDGQETGIDVPEMRYEYISLSSSGSPLRILLVDNESTDIWVYDVDSELAPQQLTFDHLGSASPLWIDDGKRYVHTSQDENGRELMYRRSADGRGRAEELTLTMRDPFFVYASSVTPDPNTLLGAAVFENIGTRAIKIPIGDSGDVEHIFDVDYETHRPVLSPDGRWLAYVSTELVTYEIFVTSYPGLEGQWRVSGADNPRNDDSSIWAPDGTAIYYRSDPHVIRVPVSTENGFRLGLPERLFEDVYLNIKGARPSSYAIHPDGDRFLFIKPIADELENSTELIVIENWLETLRNPDRAKVLR